MQCHVFYAPGSIQACVILGVLFIAPWGGLQELPAHDDISGAMQDTGLQLLSMPLWELPEFQEEGNVVSSDLDVDIQYYMFENERHQTSAPPSPKRHRPMQDSLPEREP